MSVIRSVKVVNKVVINNASGPPISAYFLVSRVKGILNLQHNFIHKSAHRGYHFSLSLSGFPKCRIGRLA